MDFATDAWPPDVTAHLLARIPLYSLTSAAAVCHAWRDAIASDEHWQVRYLQHWQRPKIVGGWRAQFKSAHHIDGVLYLCGLRAAPGDEGPTHVHAEGRPVEADFYLAMSRRLRFTHAAPGAKHFLGLASDGVLYAWGSPRGLQGSGVGGSRVHRVSMGILPRIGNQISIPTEVPSCCEHPREPMSIQMAGNIKQVHIGTCGEQCCALVTQSGDLYYFGRKTCYIDECPIPRRIYIDDPAKSLEQERFYNERVRVASVALGDEHGLLVDTTGRVFSFGKGTFGQHGLGHQHTVGDVGDPITLIDSLVFEGVVVVAVAAGMQHCLCLSSTGEVYAFGDGRQGQLGCDAICHTKPHRVVVPSAELAPQTVVLSGIASVSAGFNLSAFVTTDGAVYTCGQSNEGGLGYASAAELKFPQRVCKLASHHVTCVSVGGGHMVALTADGLVFSWGNNDHGQCGRQESEEDLRQSAKQRGCDNNGPLGLSVYDVAQVALPARARVVSAGDTATFFILGEPLRA